MSWPLESTGGSIDEVTERSGAEVVDGSGVQSDAVMESGVGGTRSAMKTRSGAPHTQSRGSAPTHCGQ